VLLFVCLFVLFGLTSSRGFMCVDPEASTIEAWQLVATGAPWLDDADPSVPENRWVHRAPNGHLTADRMAGSVALAVPGYLLLGTGGKAGEFSAVPAGLAAAFLTAGTGVLMMLALRRRCGPGLATAAAVAFALGTPTWSVSADAPWTHTVTQFGLAGAALGLARRNYWLTGVFLAVAMTGRPHVALVAAVVGLGMSWSVRRLRPALEVGLPCLGGLAALVVWNRWMFGVWTVSTPGYRGHAAAAVGGTPVSAGLSSMHDRLVNLMGFLVSPDRGLLVWTPLVLVLVPLAVRNRRDLPAWSVWLALGGVAYTLVQLQMDVFMGGDWFYGYRLGLELVTCLAPAFALSLLRAGPTTRAVVAALAGAQVAVIALGARADVPYVGSAQVWRANSFLVALGRDPGAGAALLVLCVVMGVLAARLSTRVAAQPAPGPDGYGRGPETTTARTEL